MKAQIDMDTCIKCGACEKICELEAVDFDQKPKRVSVKVGGIVVATGWDEYQPEDGYLGYGVYDNVLTQLNFERMLAPNGPSVAHVLRPSDGKEPKSLLFVQCVGSRDIKRNAYCSGGVCCMISIKNAKLVKSYYPDMEVAIAYIDIRASGKMYEEYYQKVRESGVRFIRSKVSQIREDKESKSLKVILEDTLNPNAPVDEYTFDMVVLSSAMEPSKTFSELNKELNLSTSPSGFLKEFHPRLNTVDSDVPGIVLAGASHGPKAISETIMQAKGAASSLGKLINVGEYQIKLIRAINDSEKCSECELCVGLCPYGAITHEAEGIVPDEILCRGCGICASVCPNEAMTIRYYREEQLEKQIDAFLEGKIKKKDSSETKAS